MAHNVCNPSGLTPSCANLNAAPLPSSGHAARRRRRGAAAERRPQPGPSGRVPQGGQRLGDAVPPQHTHAQGAVDRRGLPAVIPSLPLVQRRSGIAAALGRVAYSLPRLVAAAAVVVACFRVHPPPPLPTTHIPSQTLHGLFWPPALLPRCQARRCSERAAPLSSPPPTQLLLFALSTLFSTAAAGHHLPLLFRRPLVTCCTLYLPCQPPVPQHSRCCQSTLTNSNSQRRQADNN